jgi:hypothetical protein
MTRSVLKWAGGVIEFDAVEVESPTHDAVITEYPVERGANLVDHVRVNPVTFHMTAHVTNNPTRDDITQQFDGIRAVTGVDLKVRKPILPAANRAKLPTSFAGVPLTYETSVRASVRTWGEAGNPVRRVTNVYAELRNGMAEGRLYTIATDLGDYDNMLLRGLSLERSAGSANAPRFDMDFQQISFAVLSRRELAAKKVPKKPRSKPPKEPTRKQPEKADKRSESLVHDIFN